MSDITYFISYSRKDTKAVLNLAKSLKADNVSVWLDQLDIPPGKPWDRAIPKGLTDCRGMLIVLTPSSVNSENVLDEINYAKSKGKTIIPILLKPCEMPFGIQRLQYIDFTQDYQAGYKDLFNTLTGKNKEFSRTPKKSINWLVVGIIAFVLGGLGLKLASNSNTEGQHKTATTGAVDSLYQIGRAYYYSMDYQKAFPLLLQSAEQGNADAQFLVGVMYSAEQGVAENADNGLAWFQRAAQNKQPLAIMGLSGAYKDGTMVAKDSAKSDSLFDVALPGVMNIATQGDAIAQTALGGLYYDGELLEQDTNKAIDWYEKAAAQKFIGAQVSLAKLYESEGNQPKAVYWLRIAARRGDEFSQGHLKAMKEKW